MSTLCTMGKNRTKYCVYDKWYFSLLFFIENYYWSWFFCKVTITIMRKICFIYLCYIYLILVFKMSNYWWPKFLLCSWTFSECIFLLTKFAETFSNPPTISPIGLFYTPKLVCNFSPNWRNFLWFFWSLLGTRFVWFKFNLPYQNFKK